MDQPIRLPDLKAVDLIALPAIDRFRLKPRLFVGLRSEILGSLERTWRAEGRAGGTEEIAAVIRHDDDRSLRGTLASKTL